MRVVLTTTATVMGGVWRHILDLAAGLEAQGVDVVIALDDSTSRDVWTRAAACASVATLRTEIRADIWHLHLADTYDRSAVFLLGRAQRTARRRVITEHLPRTVASDVALMGRPPRPGSLAAKTAMKRLEFSLASAVVAVSSSSATFLSERYGLGPGRFTVIHNGIAPRAAAPGAAREARRFVAVGSVIAQKGFDVLIEASRHARVPWTAEVIGEGPHRVELQRQAAAAGGAVTFCGWSDDPTGAVARAAAVVMPSRWEALPYAALEAMGSGRAVVGSAVDGLVELLGPTGAGVLVPSDDPARLARALDGLAGDPARAEELGRRGHEAVAADFTLAGMVGATSSLYERLLEGAA